MCGVGWTTCERTEHFDNLPSSEEAKAKAHNFSSLGERQVYWVQGYSVTNKSGSYLKTVKVLTLIISGYSASSAKVILEISIFKNQKENVKCIEFKVTQ